MIIENRIPFVYHRGGSGFRAADSHTRGLGLNPVLEHIHFRLAEVLHRYQLVSEYFQISATKKQIQQQQYPDCSFSCPELDRAADYSVAPPGSGSYFYCFHAPVLSSRDRPPLPPTIPNFKCVQSDCATLHLKFTCVHLSSDVEVGLLPNFGPPVVVVSPRNDERQNARVGSDSPW